MTMQELFIDTSAQLQELCTQLTDSEWLALDTEFLREKTYYSKFCLLQVANSELAACIDPLAIDDLSPLRTLLENRNITKIFHAGRQDLEILYQLWGQIPQPIFDTQLAATLIGLGDQIGYASLVKQLIGKTLDKGQVRTDWSRRPLEEEQCRYALDDVIYLGKAYLQLKQQLHELGRTEWLSEDFATLTDPTTYEIQPERQWARIRGRQQLKGAQLATLQALAAWREQRASSSNRPKGWILKDEVLLDLARRAPKNLQQLGRIRGLEPRTLERWGDKLLELISKARDLPPEQWPQEKAPPPRLDTAQDALVDILMCVARLRAKEQHLSLQALTSRKELERLATGERDLEILHGWRRAVIGDDLLRTIEGKLWPKLQGGRITLLQIGS